MQETVELRWFVPGTIPEPLVHQFCTLHRESTEQRSDSYLSLPGVDIVGMKLRGEQEKDEKISGKLEIKRRLQEEEVFSIKEGIAGTLERWQKWGFALATAQQEINSLLNHQEGAAWLRIEKTRYLRAYKQTEAQGMQVVSLEHDSLPSQGCQVELTQLIHNQDHWWSLGFESLGEDTQALLNSVKSAAELFFREITVVRLLPDQSYSYPRWLSRL